MLASFYDHVREISKQECIPMGEALRLVKSLGIDALEVSTGNILGREDEVAHELSYGDLKISAIPAFLDFGKNPDYETQFSPVLEAASFLGASKILVIPGFFGEQDSPGEREEQTKRMEEGINLFLERANSLGISLTMEDFDGELAPFATISGLLRFLENCPGLSCTFDTGNFRYMNEDVLEAYEKLSAHIDHVHLKDRAYDGRGNIKMAIDQQPLYPVSVGGGDLPIGEIIARLKQDGYRGIYTLEHYDAPLMLDCLKQSVEWVKGQL